MVLRLGTIRRISAVSNLIQRIKFDKNSTSESDARISATGPTGLVALSHRNATTPIQASNFCRVESNSHIDTEAK